MSKTDDDVSPTGVPALSEARSVIAGGCLASLGSATLTCGLLFINGSLVLAILEVLDEAGLHWVREQGFSQFVLFALPVALVVVQWMMIDYVRTRFSSRLH